jgi:hypothetical protein
VASPNCAASTRARTAQKHRALAEQRIRIAAYRLATLLNETLGR